MKILEFYYLFYLLAVLNILKNLIIFTFVCYQLNWAEHLLKNVLEENFSKYFLFFCLHLRYSDFLCYQLFFNYFMQINFLFKIYFNFSTNFLILVCLLYDKDFFFLLYFYSSYIFNQFINHKVFFKYMLILKEISFYLIFQEKLIMQNQGSQFH